MNKSRYAGEDWKIADIRQNLSGQALEDINEAASVEAWDEFSEEYPEKAELFNELDNSDLNWSPADCYWEWSEIQAGYTAAVITGLSDSSVEEAEEKGLQDEFSAWKENPGGFENELENYYDAVWEYISLWIKKVREYSPLALSEETQLSEREAQLYIYTRKLGYGVNTAAAEMEISDGTAYKMNNRIKNKVEEAEKTSAL
jgi:hypothetical protein